MKGLFVIVMMLIAGASSCGKKGDPRAPELAAPRTITNLTARSEAKGDLPISGFVTVVGRFFERAIQ